MAPPAAAWRPRTPRLPGSTWSWRPRDEDKLVAMAAKMDAECRLFAVDDIPARERALAGIAVLLNCAGPFMRTAEPLIQARLAAGTHYLDIAAELDSHRLAEKYDRRHKRPASCCFRTAAVVLRCLDASPGMQRGGW